MRNVIWMVSLAAVCVSLASVASAVDIETVPIGDPGNTADVHGSGYGRVNYDYNIGRYEVSNAEYSEFLNAVATEGDPHGLYNIGMGGGSNYIGGISRTGSGSVGDPWVYAPLVNCANRPVHYVSFWDACRFANWLHNGQGAGDTENGAYTLTSDGIANNTVLRNADWKWAVTSEHEWYKAAYYDPDKPGGAGYYDYPTGSDTTPTAEVPPGTTMVFGSANYYDSGYLDTTYYMTECGAYDAGHSDSPYGTFDQAGNVWEWNDEIIIPAYRCLRGGSYNFPESSMRAATRNLDYPATETSYIGFRVSEVPEPGTMAVLMLGAIGIIKRRRRLGE